MMRSTPSLKRDTAFAVLALAVVAATSIVGQIATYPNLAPWYAGLVKPSFNPPNWIFAPVWTTLYALMAFALWRILRVRMPSGMHRRYMVGLFFLLLALNAAWSWMFFWAHSPLLGLINIVPQLGVVIATVVSFARVDRLAAFCLLPLAAWVAFAGVLNTAIWLLNN
ncbi:MAG: TspO/MBR family protein [Pseudolabrys sp.]|jgi:tryptophan-rich sensory protein